MSGPIVRTGTTPAYGDNWDKIFGGKSAKTTKAVAAKPKAKTPAKSSASKVTVAKATASKPAAKAKATAKPKAKARKA